MKKQTYWLIPLTILFIFVLLNIDCKKPPLYDLAILNGKVVAGDGNPWYQADIGIKNEKITFIGKINPVEAKTTVNAEGLYISPGFIDIHTHADRNIIKIPIANNYLLQGVTTVVGGNCGGHRYPLKEQFETIEEQGIAINFCSLAGHNSIRREVMGLKMADPTPDELEQMISLMEKEMKSGAVGFSTGLAYMPGRYSKTEELMELAKVVGKYGGIYASHIRDQGKKITEAIEEAILIGEKNNLPVQISHIKLCIEPNWGKLEMIAAPIEEARARGVEVFTDQYPYTATSSGFSSSFPAWSLEGGTEEFKKRLQSPDLYQKIKDHIIKARLVSEKGINKLQSIYIGNYEKERSWEGKNLEEILKIQGKEATIENGADLIIEIKKNGDASCVFFQMVEEDLDDIMRLNYNMVASDGGIIEFEKGVPHCRSYGTFPRILHRYVNQKKVLTLEEAVKKMTSLPAQVLRLTDRGIIKKGMYADLVIFDLNTIKDKATYQKPHQYPEGIKAVIVNGAIAAEDGQPSGQRPGKILYGPGKK
jgi:N-acyl-D-amino-acid deacylase